MLHSLLWSVLVSSAAAGSGYTLPCSSNGVTRGRLTWSTRLCGSVPCVPVTHGRVDPGVHGARRGRRRRCDRRDLAQVHPVEQLRLRDGVGRAAWKGGGADRVRLAIQPLPVAASSPSSSQFSLGIARCGDLPSLSTVILS